MTIRSMAAAAAGLSALAALLGGPMSGSAFAQSRQTDKNNMRNLGIAGGAGALYELSKGKGTNALLLGAGAAYAGKKYEDDRKAQAKAAAHRRHLAALRRRHHHHS